jgi:hypothetical protein
VALSETGCSAILAVFRSCPGTVLNGVLCAMRFDAWNDDNMYQ